MGQGGGAGDDGIAKMGWIMEGKPGRRSAERSVMDDRGGSGGVECVCWDRGKDTAQLSWQFLGLFCFSVMHAFIVPAWNCISVFAPDEGRNCRNQ